MAEYNARIKHKRDTDVNWADADPVLLDGEIIVVDTSDGNVRKKVGDGIKRYSQLPFDDEQLVGVVQYTCQSLTSEQQTQARENIGAEESGTGYSKNVIDEKLELVDMAINDVGNAVAERYIKPTTGIPASDLAQDVQESLAKVNVAMVFPASGTALANNTVYIVPVRITTYTFTKPSTSHGWAHGIFGVGDSPNITFTGNIIGKIPTFESGKRYEFDVFNGVWVVQEVMAQ